MFHFWKIFSFFFKKETNTEEMHLFRVYFFFTVFLFCFKNFKQFYCWPFRFDSPVPWIRRWLRSPLQFFKPNMSWIFKTVKQLLILKIIRGLLWPVRSGMISTWIIVFDSVLQVPLSAVHMCILWNMVIFHGVSLIIILVIVATNDSSNGHYTDLLSNLVLPDEISICLFVLNLWFSFFAMDFRFVLCMIDKNWLGRMFNSITYVEIFV